MPKSNVNVRRRVWREHFGCSLVGYCCWREKPLKFDDATVEHLTPRSRGGTNGLDNLMIACARCNNGCDHAET